MGKRITLRLAMIALLVGALAGMGTLCMGQSLGKTTAGRMPDRLWKSMPLVVQIPAPAVRAISFSPGETIGRILIPRMSLDSPLLEMANCDDQVNLNRGPAHIGGTAAPGSAGNCAIAGHRSTYGAPFGDLDQLAPDDLIEVRTVQGSFRYRVTEQVIVAPSDISVIDPVLKNPDDSSQGFAATLTLTTCNPKYSAAQRLIIKAELEPDQVALPAPEASGSPGLTEAGLSGEEGSKLPTLLSGLVLLLVGLLWWLFFHRHPRWTTWIVGAIPFAIALFIFFSYLERVLPANY